MDPKEQEQRQSLRRQARELKQRLLDLCAAMGAGPDTPLHVIFPAWPPPEDMPDSFDWNAVEAELRAVVVGRLDGYELNALQIRIVCVGEGLCNAMDDGTISVQQADRIADVLDHLQDSLDRRLQTWKDNA